MFTSRARMLQVFMASNESTMIVTANIYPFPPTILGPNVEQQQQRLSLLPVCPQSTAVAYLVSH